MGNWCDGDRHGLGLFSLASQGHAGTVLGTFLHGDLQERVQNDVQTESLKSQISEVVNDAMEIAGLARTMAPRVKSKTQDFHEDQKNTKAAFSAALLGPKTEALAVTSGPEDPDLIQSRLPKPYDSFEEWLLTIKLCHNIAESIETFTKNSPVALNISEKVSKMSSDIRNLGFASPSDLLVLLADEDDFDDFTDKMSLRAKQSRLLWKALQDLDVALTPRPVIDEGPHTTPEPAARIQMQGPKTSEFIRLFQRFCDKADKHGKPRMGTTGLQNALKSIDIQVFPESFLRAKIIGHFGCFHTYSTMIIRHLDCLSAHNNE